MRFPLAILLGLSSVVVAADKPPDVWPAVTRTAKPWTRWWWPGNAVDPPGLDAELAAFDAAGLGGVEITPIYGARGAESRYVEYLSPRWVDLLAHASAKAEELGLGVDMATGTGWPFGGPQVLPRDGSSSIALIDGHLAGKPTTMKVKRAAPGGEGLVLDPYSSDALGRYLARFDTALAPLPRGALRSQFHDSFEYYEASWTPDFDRAFRELNGYDLDGYAAELMGAKPVDDDTLSRIKGDYRRTLAKLHLDYVASWARWSHDHGFLARNQAHGAPGNLLDLYAAADIPETESFGATRLDIAGLRESPEDVNFDPDPPLNLIGRFASSAAHVAGHPLASSETLTWLRENFRESPAAAKPQIDRLLAAGINHIFYHGTCYSPADAAWPGWFFYAATQLNPNNPLWRDFGAMNAYVARVQSVLQSGRPDNDVLVYWPFDDLVDDATGLMRQFGMHGNAWLVGSSTGKLASRLLAAGFTFDFISDAQIARLHVARREIVAPGGRYSAIVVPAARRMSPSTLRSLLALERAGAAVVFEQLPVDVPGLGDLSKRRAELSHLLASSKLHAVPEVEDALQKTGIRREMAADAGLAFVRRANADGADYFLVNLTGKPYEGWLTFSARARSAALLDPMTGVAGTAVTHALPRGTGVYLQLGSGESMIVRFGGRPLPIEPWAYATAGTPVTLTGPWQLDFIRGGPTLPASTRLAEAASWTTLPDPEVQGFAGTARYRVEFDAPAAAADIWQLDLGDVRESARVTLNGVFVGTAWSNPFTLRLPGLKPRGNILEIEVTNLPANRVRDLDLRKVDWKIMKDIDLASLRYRALDASRWDVAPSGLTSPVRLVPLRIVRPRFPAL